MGVDRQSEDVALSGPILNPWDSGPAIADLQELLRAHGFNLVVDGSFGWITEAAVKTWQRQHGLRVDGIVGPATWATLKATVKPGTRLLKQGHSGADVRELQGLLLVHGHQVCRDGLFGDLTRSAVVAFQQQNRLKPTGMVDAITWNLLRGGIPLPAPPQQTKWFFDARKWW